MSITPKLYVKMFRLLGFRIKVANWLLQRGHGNRELLEKYVTKQRRTQAKLVARYMEKGNVY